MQSYYVIFCFLLIRISGTLANIDDYNLDTFIEMCRKNVTASSRHVRRIDNSDLLDRHIKSKQPSNWGSYDYIIVGAGSAGTLLANRLSEDSNRRVLLLEAGGPENDFSDIPGMTQYLSESDMDWGYTTVPQKIGCLGQGVKQCRVPRGKVMGGSSTINSKLYVRGNRADYDGWAEMGNQGWSYEEVLPYFKKTEKTNCPDMDPQYHSTEGLLEVSYPDTTIFKDVYIKGMEELGYKELDYNGEEQVGVGLIQLTLNRDRISSGGRSFIDPIIDRRNLEVVLRAFVIEVIIDKDTKTATGVIFSRGDEKFTADASLEVILSAGAYNSPQILMLSGIGPERHLRHNRIGLVQDLPAVGQNYQDHAMYFGFIVKTNQSWFNEKFADYAEAYFDNRLRPWSTPFGVETIGFFPVKRRGSSVPDIQHIIVVPPGSHADAELSPTFPPIYNPFTDLMVQVILLNPKSRGSVALKSNNPIDFPNIDPNMFSDPRGEDLDTIVEGIMETLKLLNTKSFKEIEATIHPLPAPPCKHFHKYLSRGYFRCAVMKLAMTAYHPCGTCRMGSNRHDSVVSADLKVHGMRNLRVVDASVFPRIPSGNLNAPVYMVAEKAADIIKRQNADRV